MRKVASSSSAEQKPIGIAEARTLFAPWRAQAALVLAVSGGPDSIALLWLAVRWRNAIKSGGPKLIAVTIDHELRRESAREARDVKVLAGQLGVEHRTIRWRGTKPAAGLPAAAREARYELLAKAARAAGANRIVMAHTRDDQAETLLMRLCRGSGLPGLAAMAPQIQRGDVWVLRPLLDVPKVRLVATLRRAKVAFVEDPTNTDDAFTRPRLRAIMPQLAEEGATAAKLARLAARLARANAALDAMADTAGRALVTYDRRNPGVTIDAAQFAELPEEIRLRLLMRLIDATGHEGPTQLAKAEALLADIASASAIPAQTAGKSRLARTLAGAQIRLEGGALTISPAPRRRPRTAASA